MTLPTSKPAPSRTAYRRTPELESFAMKKFTHEWIEKNPWLLIGLVILVIS